MHPKDGRRMYPAVRLLRLATKNLMPFAPLRHGFDVAGFLEMLRAQREEIIASDYRTNPWSPERAPQLSLSSGQK